MAALQMNRDLAFGAGAYGLGAGIFFVGYVLLEVPSNLVLARVGARRWIARIMAIGPRGFLGGLSRVLATARVLIAGGEAILEDLGSKNGTHLNGNRVTMPVRLSDGDEIRLGAINLTFRIAGLMSPTETLANG